MGASGVSTTGLHNGGGSAPHEFLGEVSANKPQARSLELVELDAVIECLWDIGRDGMSPKLQSINLAESARGGNDERTSEQLPGVLTREDPEEQISGPNSYSQPH